MTNGTSGRNKAIILAGLAVVVVGAGIIAFLLFTGGEEPAQTAATAPAITDGPAPADAANAVGAVATAPDATATTTDSGPGPGPAAGPQETSGTAQTHVFLPGVTPLPQPSPPAQAGPLPVLPWQEDGLNDLEARVAQDLQTIGSIDPATAHAITGLPWLTDEMNLADGVALSLFRDITAADPALAQKAASLPWLAGELLANEDVDGLLQIEVLAQDAPELARDLLDTSWVEDGISPGERLAMFMIGDIAGEDEALAREIAQSPGIADGISDAELASFTGSDNYYLERLERDHPAIAEIVKSYPWLSNSTSRNQEQARSAPGLLAYPELQNTLSTRQAVLMYLSSIAGTSPAIAERIAALPWITSLEEPAFGDDRPLYLYTPEFSAIDLLNKIVEYDVSVAETLLTMPWLAERLPGGNELAALRTVLYMERNGLDAEELLISQPWFREGITGEKQALIFAMTSGCKKVDFCQELAENGLVRSTTISLPSGELDLYVVQRPSLGPIDDRVLDWIRLAVEAQEDFIGPAPQGSALWPDDGVVLLIEPEIKFLLEGAAGYWSGHHMVVGLLPDHLSFVPVLYHETGHYHSHTGSTWLSEGGANFLEAYTFHATGETSMQSRLTELRSSQENVAEEGYSCGGAPDIHTYNLRFARQSRDCAYLLGEHFLLTLYVELGHEMVASSLRDLNFNPPSRLYQPFSREMEEAIYQAFLSNTPPERQEEFNALYRLFHGMPDLVPTEVGGETIELPENHLDNPHAIALAALYVATDGPNWRNNENWLSAQPLIEWEGVTADEDGNVINLALPNNGLKGSLPPELGDLTTLGAVFLARNQLTGPIPPELGDMTELFLMDLTYNQLTGPIPPELGKMTKLRQLKLNSNQLTGPIPEELGNLPNLSLLQLGINELSGCVPASLAAVRGVDTLNLPPC